MSERGMSNQIGHRVKTSNLRGIDYVNHNPIPEKFLNIHHIDPRSVKNKAISLCDYVLSNILHMVILTETRFGSNVDKTCISELVPIGYTMKHVPCKGK